MIGIISTNVDELFEIASSLHVALNSTPGLKYVALNYGEPFKHPNDDRYALRIVEQQPYYTNILNNLTPEQQQNIETLTNDWFE